MKSLYYLVALAAKMVRPVDFVKEATSGNGNDQIVGYGAGDPKPPHH